jgi:hypothetical protein
LHDRPRDRRSVGSGAENRVGAALDDGAAPRRDDVHELALMDDLVSIVIGAIAPARVSRVRLVVGRAAGASSDALRFCFDVCSRGTLLEGATLEILETDGPELRLKDVEVI